MASPTRGCEFEQAPEDSAGQGYLVCCGLRGRRELYMIQRFNSDNSLILGCAGSWWPCGLFSRCGKWGFSPGVVRRPLVLSNTSYNKFPSRRCIFFLKHRFWYVVLSFSFSSVFSNTHCDYFFDPKDVYNIVHILIFSNWDLFYGSEESISIPRVRECTNIKLLILTLFLLLIAFKNKDLGLPPFGNFLRILLILPTHILSSPGTPITSMENHLILHQSSWTHFFSLFLNFLFVFLFLLTHSQVHWCILLHV